MLGVRVLVGVADCVGVCEAVLVTDGVCVGVWRYMRRSTKLLACAGRGGQARSRARLRAKCTRPRQLTSATIMLPRPSATRVGSWNLASSANPPSPATQWGGLQGEGTVQRATAPHPTPQFRG